MVQAEQSLPQSYQTCNSIDSDIIYISWKKPTNDSIYYPNSTWTTGRNKLIEEAKKLPNKYLYYIFLDDDLSFKQGSFREFEKMLLEYKPAIGIPKCWNHNKRENINMLAHTVYEFDAAFNAFHQDVFFDDVLFPYITNFDEQSWWCSQTVLLCHIAHQFYHRHILQFNNIQVINSINLRYNSYGTHAFNIIENWLLNTQFTKQVSFIPTQIQLEIYHPMIYRYFPHLKYQVNQAIAPLDSYKIALAKKHEIFKHYASKNHFNFSNEDKKNINNEIAIEFTSIIINLFKTNELDAYIKNNLERIKILFAIAVGVWNYSITYNNTQIKYIFKELENMVPVEVLHNIMEKFIGRKCIIFNDDKRYIYDKSLSVKNNNIIIDFKYKYLKQQ